MLADSDPRVRCATLGCGVKPLRGTEQHTGDPKRILRNFKTCDTGSCKYLKSTRARYMPLIPYQKPWCSHADLVQKLIDRGLVVTDRPKAEAFLAHVNYYRLSGYCLAFESPGQRHTFSPGTTFEQLQAAYDFDFTLRDLVGEALEVSTSFPNSVWERTLAKLRFAYRLVSAAACDWPKPA